MSTVPAMSTDDTVRFELRIKSVRLEKTHTPTPALVPAEVISFSNLAGARSLAAQVLVTSRERGWEVFNMRTTDPYSWCVISPETVHFITIEAKTGDDNGPTD